MERQNKTGDVYTSIVCGAVVAVLGLVLLRPIAAALGAQGQLLEDSIVYGRILLLAVPAYILQYEFQCLFATAEKPAVGLYVTVAAGAANMILDALFVAVYTIRENSLFARSILPCPIVTAIRAPPPVPNINPKEPRIIRKGIIKFTAVKGVFPTKFDTKNPSTTT